MTDKVTISREDLAVIEYIKEKYKGDLEHAFNSVAPTMTVWNRKLEINQTLSLTPFEFAKVLNNGYEVSLTPEEVLFKHYQRNFIPKGYYDSFTSGIRFALDTLNITIEGINGKEATL